MADIPTLTWTSPSGTVCPLDYTGLTSYGWIATSGVKGLGAAPRTITADPMPVGGTAVRKIYPGPRLITLPLYVEGADHATFLTAWRTLGQAFAETLTAGAGTLTVTRPDGTTRLIDAYYQDGYDISEGTPTSDVMALTLYCPDPYFRDLDPTLISRAETPLGVSFLSPFPTVSSSQTLGTTTVTNPGGVTAWPTWTLTGPASGLTATNSTTGESFDLDIVTYTGSPLADGDTVTITTSPPSVVDSSGTNLTGALDWPSAVLWGLPPGDSNVSFIAGGSGTNTAVEASFYARYETS